VHPELGLLGYFDFVLTAQEVGSEKPEGVLFQTAISAYKDRVGSDINITAQAQSDPSALLASSCWHVGNSVKHDVDGAVGSGWNAVLLNPAIEAADAVQFAERNRSGSAPGAVQKKFSKTASDRIYYEINDIQHLLTVLRLNHP
jgi:FMN phosphatase YigB (HAD superfamily)